MRILLPILGLLMLSAAPALAQGRAENSVQLKQIAEEAAPWTGRRLAASATLSCDIKICSQMPIGKNLAALIGLKAGQLITQIDIQAAWSRLKRTGFFSKIELDFIEGPAKKGGETPAVYLRFIGTGTVVIQTLDVEYGSWGSSLYPKQFVSEIRKRLPLRRGVHFLF